MTPLRNGPEPVSHIVMYMCEGLWEVTVEGFCILMEKEAELCLIFPYLQPANNGIPITFVCPFVWSNNYEMDNQKISL